MEISVAVALPGWHVLENTLDPRIRLLDTLDGDAPDLLVFSCGQDRRLEKTRTLTLPGHILRGIAERRTGLVFDACTEGILHKPDLSGGLHAAIAHFGAAPEQCVYLTQERNYEADYRAYCAAVGWARPAHILVHDYWIWYGVERFRQDGERMFQDQLQAFRSRPASRARRFVSLNRTPRPTKILFLLRLLRDDLWRHGFISFGGFRAGDAGPGKGKPSEEDLRRALPGFEDLVHELMPQMDALAAVGQQLLGMEQHGWSKLSLWNASLAADMAEYADSWFSIVTETEMRPRPSRITEKILKPLVNFQPFIVLGNPGALKMIREYGFVTFDNVVDESYDEELDPRRRFDMAYAEFRRLCEMDERALAQMAAAVEERVVFNAQWAFTRLSQDVRREHDRAMVDTILRATFPAGAQIGAHTLPRSQETSR